jgi:hypothetical protein
LVKDGKCRWVLVFKDEGGATMDRIEQSFIMAAMTGFWVFLAGVTMLEVWYPA